MMGRSRLSSGQRFHPGTDAPRSARKGLECHLSICSGTWRLGTRAEMQFKGHIRLGQIGGIEIGLDFSWFIIAVLITFSLLEQFHRTNPQWGNAVIGSAAVITASLFFFTLLLHELAHCLMARRNGLRVRAITLFALGGVSQIESEARDAKSEFWIAIVGPATSLVIGAILLELARAAGWASATRLATPVTSVLGW